VCICVLCCTVLYCTVLYCTLLYCTVLYCTVLYCTVLYGMVLYCTVLYSTVWYCIVLYCTVLYCTVLYCIALYCTVLYHTLLYCNIFAFQNCSFAQLVKTFAEVSRKQSMSLKCCINTNFSTHGTVSVQCNAVGFCRCSCLCRLNMLVTNSVTTLCK
jgi:hypothetical protein